MFPEIGVPAAKMLLLAGVDRLDRELTVYSVTRCF